jgi:nitrate reductase gamma subunit
MQHLTGEEMLRFMGWANAIITFNPEAPNLLSGAAWIYKLHIILGLTLFLITPFTRLVHIWSVPVWYLLRPGYQIVRSLGPVRRTPTAEIYAASPNYGSRTLPNYGGTTVMRQHTESGESGA